VVEIRCMEGSTHDPAVVSWRQWGRRLWEGKGRIRTLSTALPIPHLLTPGPLTQAVAG
jgi:hypothetical protein